METYSAKITQDSYAFLQDYVYRESGIVLEGDKHYLMEARLTPLLRGQGLRSIDDLCALVRATSDHPVRQQVVEAMTTNETFFFRDPAQYDALKSVVIPELMTRHCEAEQLRFWSAAASTGQEAYSLAMMLAEMGLSDWDIQILGTDLSSQVLDRASEGRYLQIEVNRGLPASLLVKYFTRSGLDWQLSDKVRRMVRFARLDLRKSMHALGPFDLVFCRNVLIYFDLDTKKRIMNEIRGTLYTGGYLLLGGSETTLNLCPHFAPETCGKSVVYRAI
jgi:chemotaxis protein methyltransferase CheR